MSEPGATHATAAVVPRTPPLPMARIDPPVEVQAAVGAALRACYAWKPVVVTPSRVDPRQPAALPHLPMSVEAAICDTIDDWPHNADANDYAWLGLGVVLGLFVVLVLLVLRRLVRAFGRTAAGFWLRDRLREPLRVIATVSLGVPLGALVGGAASDLLLKAGLNSAFLSDVLCLLGGFGGAYAMAWLHRRQRQREEQL